MKKKKEDELEQYKDVQIADMNVEGMPWYVKKEDSSLPENMPQQEPLPLKMTWKLIGGSVLAALAIGGVFFFSLFLFLLFCVNVWLK